MPARDDFENLSDESQAKILALFKRLADFGRISNCEKFRNLGQRSGKETRGAGLWEFKSFQDRFLGDFRPGKRFVIATYTQKKKDTLDPAVITRAVRILAESDARDASLGR